MNVLPQYPPNLFLAQNRLFSPRVPVNFPQYECIQESLSGALAQSEQKPSFFGIFIVDT